MWKAVEIQLRGFVWFVQGFHYPAKFSARLLDQALINNLSIALRIALTLNFDEFVFLPEPGADYSGSDYRSKLLRYYFHEPCKNRLNRAWKRTASLSNLASGGHCLRGDTLKIFPVNHVLRHYIALSENHAKQKYLNRRFDSVDLQRGWHRKRLNITERDLVLPGDSEYLFRLDGSDDPQFCRDKPASTHYWQWGAAL